MPYALPHPCAQPGCGALVAGQTRCAQHQRSVRTDLPAWTKQVRPSSAFQGYDAEYRRNRKLLLEYQPWCSACGTTENLTADHILAYSQGGGNGFDNLQVLCRSCNSRKSRQEAKVWVRPLDPRYAIMYRDLRVRQHSHVIHLIGPAASGKSTLRRWLMDQLSIPSFGIDDERRALSQDRIPDDLPAWVNLEHHVDSVPSCVLETSGRNGNDRVLLYGRHRFTIHCTASDSVRRARLDERVRTGDLKTHGYANYVDRLLNQQVPRRPVEWTWDTTTLDALNWNGLRNELRQWR